jgi:hypothetical protein
MTNHQRAEAAAKAEDLSSLLDHIAWAEAVKPILLKRRDAFSQMLVQTILGATTPDGKQPYTKEQLAGSIYGIDAIIGAFEKVLKDGEKALQELRQQNLSLSASSQ